MPNSVLIGITIDDIVRSASTLTTTTYHTPQSAYGRTIASACFKSFFSKNGGVFVSATTPFNWLHFSGTFEDQILQEYRNEGIGWSVNPNTGKLYGELEPYVPSAAADTEICIAHRMENGYTKSAFTLTNLANGQLVRAYGGVIGDFIVSRYFGKNTSTLNPIINFGETSAPTINEIAAIISAAFLTNANIPISAQIATTTSASTYPNYFSGYIGYKTTENITSANLNDYIRSAASFVYRIYLGKNYLWHGTKYDIPDYTAQSERIHYQYSGSTTFRRNAWASGWVGDIRTYFHLTMNDLINNY